MTSHKQAWTKGPWFYGQESIDPEWYIVTIEGGLIVANVNAHHHQAGNAALISAAPEMYEALKRAEIAVQELCNDQHPGNECWNILREIRAALTKAEGGKDV
jgi:hypothetical protein